MLTYCSVTELPFLSGHRTVLLHLLSRQPLHDTVHVETMISHCRERERERERDGSIVSYVELIGQPVMLKIGWPS